MPEHSFCLSYCYWLIAILEHPTYVFCYNWLMHHSDARARSLFLGVVNWPIIIICKESVNLWTVSQIVSHCLGNPRLKRMHGVISILLSGVVNHRRACAERVTVVGLSVCLFVCLSVCRRFYRLRGGE